MVMEQKSVLIEEGHLCVKLMMRWRSMSWEKQHFSIQIFGSKLDSCALQ